jgi:hypothetical protein
LRKAATAAPRTIAGSNSCFGVAMVSWSPFRRAGRWPG